MKRKYGSMCVAGGRTVEITSEHREWVDWAVKALYAQDDLEKKQKQQSGTGEER